MSTMSAEITGHGWARLDARPGVRNHVLALSTVAPTARVLAITPAFSHGLCGPDAALQERIIEALIRHPNTGAALVVVHDAPAAESMRLQLADLK